MKRDLSTAGPADPGELDRNARDSRRINRPSSGDPLLCIYLAQNPGLTRRYIGFSDLSA